MSYEHPRAWPGGHEAGVSYHQRMLGDPHRITAYDRAIRRLIKPGDVVLDVGSGTGMLSLLAARAGARVHAVESQDLVGLAATLARTNGLSSQVQLHHCDIRELDVIEPVDLIISDFMGRFVFDDRMQEAMAAALRWLKPDGRVCPQALDLYLAPVHLGHFAPLDTGIEPLLGLDFSPVAQAAAKETMGTQIDPSMLLAQPQPYAHLAMHEPIAPRFARTITFQADKTGRCRAIAGWFRAQLAPDVVLTTQPGVETHWGQMLFPCSPCQVTEGTTLTFELAIPTDKPQSHWQWNLQTSPAGNEAPAPRSAAPTSEDKSAAESANDSGIQHFQAGDFASAATQFRIAISLLDLGDGPRAAALYENLGLAYVNAGNFVPAVTAFLRALDGEPASREQSLRFLVDACFQSHRPLDGMRYLALFEEAFGPHPSGWRAESDQSSE